MNAGSPPDETPSAPATPAPLLAMPVAAAPDGTLPRPVPRPRPRAPAAVLVLATLATGFTLWAARGLLLPVLLAMFFALIGNPIIRVLQKAYVPRFVSALLVLVLGLAGTGVLASQLIVPASEWIRQVSREMRDLAPKLRDLARPVQEANKAAENIARAAGGENIARPVQVVRTEVNDPYRALTATPRLIAAVLAVVLLTFFFMVYGQSLQRNAIALLPGRQQKKLTVEILQEIEHEMSRYVLTISLINILVGLLLAVPLMVCFKIVLTRVEGLEGWARLLE
jgi:predicted PurR-regulated permease PerM